MLHKRFLSTEAQNRARHTASLHVSRDHSERPLCRLISFSCVPDRTHRIPWQDMFLGSRRSFRECTQLHLPRVGALRQLGRGRQIAARRLLISASLLILGRACAGILRNRNGRLQTKKSDRKQQDVKMQVNKLGDSRK